MKTFEPYVEERPNDLEIILNVGNAGETIKIFLNKGSSFGSNHLTTKLIADAIISIDEENRSTALDIGCGSGILTILLFKLKYRQIKSIDIDTYVLKEAKKNIISNFGYFPSNISLTDENVHQLNSKFNLIAINISGNFISNNFKMISNLLAQGGYLIISGFNCNKEKKFIRLANQNNLFLDGKFLQNPWISLVFKKFSI
ncbi:MAG TPA: methyltransferase domain-containing protein [Candidatus Dadabacteria bacterium]|jgi:ribosomal protein L11 methyltransferase|nr:methyltransferase domain-containing protein [Candidatus Dadabacteria bacterium]